MSNVFTEENLKNIEAHKMPNKSSTFNGQPREKHLRNKSQSNKSSILTLCDLYGFHHFTKHCCSALVVVVVLLVVLSLQETFMDRANLKSNCDIGPEQIRYNVDRIAKYIQAKCFMILNSDDIVCVFYFI